MNARTAFSFSLVLALAACGDAASDSATSATPAKDSAAAKSSGAPSAKAQTSTASSAAPPPTVAASAPASASASASAVASAKAPPPKSTGMSNKEQDDLLAEMMGGGSTKPTPSAGPANSAAPAAAAPAGAAIADAFTGAPDAAIKLGKTLKVAGYSIDLPDGWEGSDADNMIKANSKGKGAWIFATGGAANDEGVTAFLKKNATADGLKWSPANPLKVGKAAVDGKVSKGTGKVGADDADFAYFAAGDGAVYFTTVATKKSTDDERKQLVAAVRSFRK